MRSGAVLLLVLFAGCTTPTAWPTSTDACTGSSVSQVLRWPGGLEEPPTAWLDAGMNASAPHAGIPVTAPEPWGATNVTRVAWSPFGGRPDGARSFGYVDGQAYIGNETWSLHTWSGSPMIEGLFLADREPSELMESLTTFLDQIRRVDHDEHEELAAWIVAQGAPYHPAQRVDEDGGRIDMGPSIGIEFKVEIPDAGWRNLTPQIERATTTFDLGSARASWGAWLYDMDRSRWILQSERVGADWHRVDFDQLGYGRLHAELDGPINETAAMVLAGAVLASHGLSDAQRIGAPRIDTAICA